MQSTTTTATMMMNNNDWPLIIKIPDFEHAVKELRVQGGQHIGGCIIKLINLIVTTQTTDWSDYALWWPAKKFWLLKTKYTLDQYGLQANDQLVFTHIHKNVCLELPDLQQIDMMLNFSTNLFEVVQSICKNLGIKHFEELSLLKITTNANVVCETAMTTNKDKKLSVGGGDDNISFDYDPQHLAMSPIVSNIQDKLKMFSKYKTTFDKCRVNN